MKVGDDIGKKYRQKFLKWDPVEAKFDRMGWVVLLILFAYLAGHIIYAFFTL